MFLFLIHLASLDVDRLSERSMDISVLRNLYRRCNLGREFCISRNNIIFIVFNEFINNVKDFINLRNKVSSSSQSEVSYLNSVHRELIIKRTNFFNHRDTIASPPQRRVNFIT